MRKFLKRMTGIFLCVAMAAGVYGAIPAYAEGTDTGTDIQAQAAQWQRDRRFRQPVQSSWMRPPERFYMKRMQTRRVIRQVLPRS